MDLWKARKRYRRLAQDLRRRPGSAALEQLEERVLATMLRGERLETELSLIHFARRGLEGRLRRSIEWLERSALLSRTPRSALVRRFDEAALARFEPELAHRSAEQTTRAVQQLRRDLQALDRRLEELKRAITSTGTEAADLLAALTAA